MNCGRLEPAGIGLLRTGPETLTPLSALSPPAVRAETPTAAKMTAVRTATRSQPHLPG